MLSALFLLLAAGWLVYRWKRAAPTDSVIPPEQPAPHGGTRCLLWIMTSCSARVVEEIVYRGIGTTVLSWYDVAAGWVLSRNYPLRPQSSQLALG